MLAIGLLVDDAIVVVENVARVMEEDGLPPREATIKTMGQITGALNGGAAGDSNIVAHFRGDNARQGGFAQAGRAVEQNVIQRFLPGQSGLHVNAEAVFYFRLTEIFRQRMGAQAALLIVVFRAETGGNQSFFVLHGFTSSWDSRQCRFPEGPARPGS